MFALANRGESRTLFTNVMFVLTANFMLVLTAKFKIPAFFVDVSLQSMVAVMMPLILGPKRAFAAMGLYLAEGVMGYPVFQGTPERGLGLAYMMGTTGGYLAGFLLWQNIGWLFSARDPWLRLSMGIASGHAVIHACGLFWLTQLLGFDKAIAIDSQFWPGLLIKCFVSVLILKSLFHQSKSGH